LAISAQVIGLQSREAAAGQMAAATSPVHFQSAELAGTRWKLPLMREEE
jgi:hypothetical protein